MECGHCEKIFSNKNNLKIHQRTAKYCLILQGKTLEVIDKDTKYCCGICSKLSTVKSAYDKHMLRCLKTSAGQMITKLRTNIEELDTIIKTHDTIIKTRDTSIDILRNDIYSKDGMIALMQDKIDRQEAAILSMEKSLIDIGILRKEVDIYKSQAAESKNCIEEIAKQPKISTTNTTNNTLNMHKLDISDDRVKSVIEVHFGRDYMMDGAKGVAKLIIDNILDGPDGMKVYSLTDRAREYYQFKNSDGIIEKDTKGRKLLEVVYKNGINEKTLEIQQQMMIDEPDRILECLASALEVKDLDPNVIRSKSDKDKVEHMFCKELRETAM
jgi:hypothetical protein